MMALATRSRVRALTLALTLLVGDRGATALAQSTPPRPGHDVAAPSAATRQRAALIELLEIVDLGNAARVARGALTAAQADALLAATARQWTAGPPADRSALVEELRSQTEILLDYVALRVATSRTWPPDRSGVAYRDLAGSRLGRLQQSLGQAPPPTLPALRGILGDAAEILAWTTGQATLAPANDPFGGARDRAFAALSPTAPRAAAPTSPPVPRPGAPPADLSGGKLAAAVPSARPPLAAPTPPTAMPGGSAAPPPLATTTGIVPPAAGVAATTPPVAARPPGVLPAGAIALGYFGLFKDTIGKDALQPNGTPDGRFILTIVPKRLTSRDIGHISLQAMDAASRPIGPVWHTADSTRSLLGVVGGNTWLNNGFAPTLATLDSDEPVDLILFADGAPTPDAVAAFIVEVAFADGSSARLLARSR